jgi:hypothetical protein
MGQKSVKRCDVVIACSLVTCYLLVLVENVKKKRSIARGHEGPHEVVDDVGPCAATHFVFPSLPSTSTQAHGSLDSSSPLRPNSPA